MADIIVDHWGGRWSAFETRQTRHGWPIYLGRPADTGTPMNRVGGNRVILTSDLVAYMESVRYDRSRCDLPISDTVVTRIRKFLGFIRSREWWEQHADELATMTATEFAGRYGYSVVRVYRVRMAMLGRRRRERGWWRLEPARSLLAGDAPRQRIAEELGISVGTVGRLRWVLRTKGGDQG